MSLRLIKRLRYNLTSCEDLRFYKKAGNLREHHLLISIQLPALEKVRTHPTSITYIYIYFGILHNTCQALKTTQCLSLTTGITYWWCWWYQRCFMNSVRRKVWMMDVSGCQFIYLSLSRKPSETLHQPTSTPLLKSNNWVLVSKKGYKLGEQPLKKGTKEAKSNTSNLWKCFFSLFCAPHYNRACYNWLPLWKTSPRPPKGITLY